MEGSLFLCKCADMPRFQLVILNRNSNENFTIGIGADIQLQNADPYLIFRQQETTSKILGIWFHNGKERNDLASSIERAVQSLKVDPGAAASALLSPLTLGDTTIPVTRVPASPASATPTATATPQRSLGSNNSTPTPAHPPVEKTALPTSSSSSSSTAQASAQQQPFVLDKKSLQLSLLSLIQDERFLDLIHAQYLKVAHARANRKPE